MYMYVFNQSFIAAPSLEHFQSHFYVHVRLQSDPVFNIFSLISMYMYVFNQSFIAAPSLEHFQSQFLCTCICTSLIRALYPHPALNIFCTFLCTCTSLIRASYLYPVLNIFSLISMYMYVFNQSFIAAPSLEHFQSHFYVHVRLQSDPVFNIFSLISMYMYVFNQSFIAAPSLEHFQSQFLCICTSLIRALYPHPALNIFCTFLCTCTSLIRASYLYPVLNIFSLISMYMYVFNQSFIAAPSLEHFQSHFYVHVRLQSDPVLNIFSHISMYMFVFNQTQS